MADLGFLVEFIVSLAAITVPIVLIVHFLDKPAVADLFTVPIRADMERGPSEEETPPRWRTERLQPRDRAPTATIADPSQAANPHPVASLIQASPAERWAR